MFFKNAGDNEEKKKAGMVVSDYLSRTFYYNPKTGEKAVYEHEMVKKALTELSELSAEVADKTTEKVALDLLKIIATDAASYTTVVASKMKSVLVTILLSVENDHLIQGLKIVIRLLENDDFPNKDKNFPNNKRHIWEGAIETFTGGKISRINVILPSFFENVGFNVD